MKRRRRHVAAVSGILAAATLLVLAPALLAGGEEGDDDRLVRRFVVSARDGASDGAYLGIHVEEDTDSVEGGARVVRVVEGSPADDAGLQDGDVIVAVEADTIRGPGALTRRVRDREPGDVVAVKVRRDGETVTLTATLGERPRVQALMFGDEDFVPLQHFDTEEWEKYGEQWEEWAEEHAQQWEEWAEQLGDEYEFDDDSSFHWQWSGSAGRPRLGVQLVEATPELRQHLGGPENAGVLVSKVLEKTPAESAGILVGDLIVSANGKPVENSGDLIRALRGLSDENLSLELIRDGRTVTVEALIPESDEDTGPRAFAEPRVLRIPGGETMILTTPEIHVLGGEMPVLPVMPPLPEIVIPDIPEDVLIELENEMVDPDVVRREIELHREEIEAAREAAMEARREALESRRDRMVDAVRGSEDARSAERVAAAEAAREATRERLDAVRAEQEVRREALERIRRELERTLADDGLIVI